MKLIKYTALFAVSAILASGMYTGCGSNNTSSNQSQSDTSASSTASQQDSSAVDSSAASGDSTSSSDSSPSGLTFTTKDLDGKDFTQENFKDSKITMLNVWATYCGPCLNEMPDLGALAKEYADKGVQIVGIVSDADGTYETISDNSKSTIQDAIKSTGADYTHLLPSESLISSLLGNVQVVPTTYFIDSKGTILGGEYLGSKSKSDWASILDELLKSQK